LISVQPAGPPRRWLVALAGAALVAAPAIARAAAKPRVVKVEMHDMAFEAPPEALRVGDAVEWVNADIFRHTATARNGAFDVDLAPKARARTVFHKPGTYAFYCRYHPGMQGKLTVTA
jgi:plastocyanin